MKSSENQKVLTGQTQFKLIRISEVSKLTTISKSHLYTLIRQGKFIKPRKLGRNTSVWVESQVLDWLSNQLGLDPEEVA